MRIDRYDIVEYNDGRNGGHIRRSMLKELDGEWCRFNEYEKLASENTKLRALCYRKTELLKGVK